MWLMGKVLVCLAILPAPSLNKRRKPGFVKVVDALSLYLGFLGRSFYVTEFSSPPQIFFSSFSPPTNGVPNLLVFFYFVVFLSVLPPLYFSFRFFGFFFVFLVFLVIAITVFLHQWGLSCSPSLPNFIPSPSLAKSRGRGRNPSMPKIYAKHNSIACRFVTAKKPCRVEAGDRSLSRMSSRVERRAPQSKELILGEALFWNCPRTPLKSSPCLKARSPLVYVLCTGGGSGKATLTLSSLRQQDGLLFMGNCRFPAVWHPWGLLRYPRGSGDDVKEH